MTSPASPPLHQPVEALSGTEPFPDARIRREHNGKSISSYLHKQRMTVLLPTPLIERLRNAVYWTEQHTLARIIADVVEDAVTELEHSNGGMFPPRLAPLKPGRPQRKASPVGASFEQLERELKRTGSGP